MVLEITYQLHMKTNRKGIVAECTAYEIVSSILIWLVSGVNLKVVQLLSLGVICETNCFYISPSL